MVMMFCAFEGRPLIVRLHGQAEVVEAHYAEFLALRTRFSAFVRSFDSMSLVSPIRAGGPCSRRRSRVHAIATTTTQLSSAPTEFGRASSKQTCPTDGLDLERQSL